jgi:hypothetical protein
MMIIDVCLENITQLKKNRDASEGREDVGALDLRKKELQECAEPLKNLAKKSMLLCSYDVPLSSSIEVDPVDKLITILTQCSDDLTEIPNESSLKKGRRWSKLLENLKKLSDDIAANQETNWKEFFNGNFFEGSPPSMLKHKINQSRENLRKFDTYTSLYSKFASLGSKIPEDKDELKKLREISDKLGNIKLIFEDLPPGVKMFLDAVAMGAGLETVTPEIIDYLRKNDLLSGYVVNKRPY